MLVALALALSVEALVVLCALVAWRSHRARHGRLEDRFAAAADAARRLAFQARIADARLAELSELALEQALADLGLGPQAEPG